MSNLATTIRRMLSRKEAVILPGFGTLLIAESKGTADGSGRIDPPGLIVRFDATHPKEDGKLAQEYADVKEIEHEEAHQQVLELVDAIKFSLDKGEEHQLERVGTFSRDDDNRIHFHKDPGWILDPSLFGLSTLELLELEDEDERASLQDAGTGDSEKESVSVGEPTVEKTAAAQKTESVVEPPRARRRPVNKWGIIWIVIGSLAAVLVIILLIPTNNDVEFGRDGIVIKDANTEDLQDQEASSEVEFEDTGNDADLGEEVSDTRDTGAVGSEEDPDTGQPDLNRNRYFIIGGSFQKLPNATELMNQLKSEGFQSEIIITENRMYRVSVQS